MSTRVLLAGGWLWAQGENDPFPNLIIRKSQSRRELKDKWSSNLCLHTSGDSEHICTHDSTLNCIAHLTVRTSQSMPNLFLGRGACSNDV
jgi:hypothetical protein